MMKKLITLLMLSAIVMLGSCNSTMSKADDVAKKVEAGQDLNEEDIMVIVDYLNTALDDVEKSAQELGPLNADNKLQYKEAAAKLHEKYPHMIVLQKTLIDYNAKGLSQADKEIRIKVMARMAALPNLLLWNNTL